MTDSLELTPIEVPSELTDRKKTKTVIDKFVDRDFTIEAFLPSLLLFLSLCTVNVPFAFFYTSLFIYFSGYRDTNYELYHNFMAASICLFGYFLLLILSLQIINSFGSINLHPNSSERPYFYFR